MNSCNQKFFKGTIATFSHKRKQKVEKAPVKIRGYYFIYDKEIEICF
jgi:hypothetical protein